MSFLLDRQQRAAFLISVLGVALVFAVWPYFSGLLGAPVLYVLFAGLHRRLSRHIGSPAPPRIVVILLAFLVIVLPVVGAAGLLANEAASWAAAVRDSELLDRLSTLQVGDFKVGEELKRVSSVALSWLGGNALGAVGTGAKLLIQFTLTFFGLVLPAAAAG